MALRRRKIHAEDCGECATRAGKLGERVRELTLPGDLDVGERDRLLKIADKCPVHRPLQADIRIVTATTW